MAKKHETVYQMGTDKPSATSNKNTLALRRCEKLNWRETSQGSIRDGIVVWMIDRLGLIKSLLVRPFRFLRFFLDQRHTLGITISYEVMGSEVQRTKGVDGDLAVETKPIETNRGDFLSTLIDWASL